MEKNIFLIFFTTKLGKGKKKKERERERQHLTIEIMNYTQVYKFFLKEIIILKMS